MLTLTHGSLLKIETILFVITLHANPNAWFSIEILSIFLAILFVMIVLMTMTLMIVLMTMTLSVKYGICKYVAIFYLVVTRNVLYMLS